MFIKTILYDYNYEMHPLRLLCLGLFFWNVIGFITLAIDKDTGAVALMGGFMPLMGFICICVELNRSIREYLKCTNEVTPVEEPLMEIPENSV